jgi:hypothetical protein
VPEKNVDVDEDKLNETEHEVKVVGEFFKSLLFREMMRGLSPHRRPQKDRMRDKMVSYINLFRPGPPPSESSKKFAKRK